MLCLNNGNVTAVAAVKVKRFYLDLHAQVTSCQFVQRIVMLYEDYLDMVPHRHGSEQCTIAIGNRVTASIKTVDSDEQVASSKKLGRVGQLCENN